MVFTLKPLPAFLLLTLSPPTRIFFERALRDLETSVLIHVESEQEFFAHLSRVLAICLIVDDTTPAIHLPSLCEQVRLMPDHRYTPLLVISNQLKKGFMRKALQAGATDFLRHPLEEEDFFARFEVAKKIAQTENKVSNLQAQFKAIKSEDISLKAHTILSSSTTHLIHKALESSLSTVLLLLDIDQFKKLPKEKRKALAKTLLKHIEATLKTLLRPSDLLFHQAKSQFLILLPHTSYQSGEKTALKIKNFFCQHAFSIDSQFLSFTLSIGLAFYSNENKATTKKAAFYLDHLLREAQACLNEAKKLGNTLLSTYKEG